MRDAVGYRLEQSGMSRGARNESGVLGGYVEGIFETRLSWSERQGRDAQRYEAQMRRIWLECLFQMGECARKGEHAYGFEKMKLRGQIWAEAAGEQQWESLGRRHGGN